MKAPSDIPYSPNLKLESLEISNTYTNISTEELLNITDKMCDKHNIEDTLKLEITKISKLIIKQNFFKFRDKPYLQKNGLAMGGLNIIHYIKNLFAIHWKHKIVRYPSVLRGGRIL